MMIGIKGEVYPNIKEKFDRTYHVLDTPYVFDGEYAPTVKDMIEGETVSLIPYAKACVANGESYIYVRQLDHRMKIFTEWDEESYMLGTDGDYLAVRKEELHDIYIIEEKIFEKTYEKVSE